MTRKLHRVLLPLLSVALLAGGSLAQMAVTATPASAADLAGLTVSAPATSVTGEMVHFFAIAAGSSGVHPSGTVDFLDGATVICTAADLTDSSGSNSTASCDTASLTVGAHTITAQYSGDSNYGPDTSAPESLVVNKADTTTTPGLDGASSNPSPFSAPVGVTATVATTSPGTGTPTGDVEFKDGLTVISGCAGVTLNGGLAICTAPDLAFGNHTITTTYLGNDDDTTSTNTLSHDVGNAGTTTILSSSNASTTSNEAVTYTATIAPVDPATATPDGGTVEFFVDGDVIDGCEGQDVGLGVATCETVSEPVGSPLITAHYSGTDNFDGSDATGITQSVGNADTTTNLSVAPLNTSFAYGDAITFTATIAPVSPATVAPDAGTVTFLADSVPITNCELLDVSAGTASCVTSTLAAGIPSITADYSGTTGFNDSFGSTSVIIAPADSETAVTSSSNPAAFSETVTFTATVSSGGSTPSGTVDFTADDAAIDGCSAVPTTAGVATCATAALPVGANHAIVASFTSTDGNHNGSTAPAFAQDVTRADTSIGVISDHPTSTYSEPVTFSASITSTAPATATPDEGTVEFKNDSTTITGCNAQPVVAGVATCTTGTIPVGSASSFTAVFGGTESFNTSTSSGISQPVTQASTTTAVTSSDASTAAGESVTLTATVSPVAPAIGTPASGTVDFFVDTEPVNGCGAVAVSGGAATCDTSNLAVGALSVTAVFNGVTNYAASTSPPFTQAVGLAATTTTLETNVNPSVFAAPVTFTAAVEIVAPGSAPLTGTVAFQQGNVDISSCEARPVSSGLATCRRSDLPLGGSTITAIYSGTARTATSTSSAVTQNVGQAASSTALTSAPNSSIFSQSVVFTATVSAAAPSTGTPAGTVSFSADEVTLSGCGSSAMTSGVATCTVPAFQVGDHHVVASYAESADYASSSSAPTTQTVNHADTTTSVTTGDSTTTWSEGVTYTATIAPVSPATATVTGGTVDFRANGTSLTGCTAVALTSGTATCTTGTTPVGSPSITAVFSGDGEFNTSTSSGITQTVVKATTSTVLVTSNPAAVLSQSITFTATISPTAPATAPPAGGSVNFNLFGSSFTACTAQPVNSSGIATCTTTAVPLGDHLVAASYSGNGNFKASVSPLIDQSVTQASTTTAVTSSEAPSRWRDTVTFTATVTPTAPATLAPSSGTASFSADGAVISDCATQPVTNGLATCATKALSIATHPITAIYSGTDDYLTSTAPAFGQVVNTAASSTAVTSSDDAPTFGESVTLTATVSPTDPATATPSGTVAFFMDADPISGCSTQAMTDGAATCDISTLAIGTTAITAIYSGDASFDTSASPDFDQAVDQAGSTTEVTSSDPTSTFSESITLTATVSPVAPATTTPTGTVGFFIDDEPIIACGTVSVTTGTASCATTLVPVGSHDITATYSGDDPYLTSTSSATNQSVTKQSTTTVVTTGDATTVRTEPVTFTATVAPVAPATAIPGGAVAFNLSGIPISGCTARTVTNGVATCTTTVLPVGTALSITALYSGDGISVTSTSSAISQAVAKATATTVISSSKLDAVFGESVTLTATLAPVAPATIAPTSGTVAFADGGIAIGTCDEQRITAGVATCTTDALTIGSHTLTAIAAPTADFESSTSPAVTQTIDRSPTHTALTPMDTPAKVGKSVRFHVAVTSSGPGEGTPTGIVALYRVRANDSREWIGRASLRAGSATITVAGIPVGLHLIVAEYRGDADFGPSHRSARQRIDR